MKNKVVTNQRFPENRLSKSINTILNGGSKNSVVLVTISTFLSFSAVAQEKTLVKTQTVEPVTLSKTGSTQTVEPVKLTTTETVKTDDNDGIPDSAEILQHTKNLRNISYNIFSDFDYGSFGFSAGVPDQSPAADPFPGLWSGGKYNEFYSLSNGQYSYVANAVTPRSKTQHANALDPVYGETGQFFATAQPESTLVTQSTLSNLLVGATYEISLWAANSQPEGNPNEIKVRTDDKVILDTGPLAASATSLPWKKYTGTMLATSDTATVALASTMTNAEGNEFYLDNIEVRRH